MVVTCLGLFWIGDGLPLVTSVQECFQLLEQSVQLTNIILVEVSRVETVPIEILLGLGCARLDESEDLPASLFTKEGRHGCERRFVGGIANFIGGNDGLAGHHPCGQPPSAPSAKHRREPDGLEGIHGCLDFLWRPLCAHCHFRHGGRAPTAPQNLKCAQVVDVHQGLPEAWCTNIDGW